MAVMAAMLVASAAPPALARVEQEAVNQVVNQAQDAATKPESFTAYQAVEQAQNSNRVADQSSIHSSNGSITSSDALFLAGTTVGLLIAGVVLTRRVVRRQSQRHL